MTFPSLSPSPSSGRARKKYPAVRDAAESALVKLKNVSAGCDGRPDAEAQRALTQVRRAGLSRKGTVESSEMKEEENLLDSEG